LEVEGFLEYTVFPIIDKNNNLILINDLIISRLLPSYSPHSIRRQVTYALTSSIKDIEITCL